MATITGRFARSYRLAAGKVYAHVFRSLRRTFRAAALDTAIILASYTVAFLARAFTAPLDLLQNLGFMTYAVIVTLLMLNGCGVYQRLWSRTSGHGVVVIVKASAAAFAVLLATDLMFFPRPMPLSVVILGNVLALVGFTSLRYRSRLVSGASWRWRAIWHHEFPRHFTRVLIVGAGDAGQMLAMQLKYHSRGDHYHVVGFVDDDPDKQGLYVEGSPVLGTRADIVWLAESKAVDLIVVAIHNISGPAFRAILHECELTHARIKVIPNVLGLMRSKRGGAWLRDVQPEDLIGRSIVSPHGAIDLTPVRRKVILVTGAAGSIGSELSRQLCLYEPVELILLDNNESGLHDLTGELSAEFPDAHIIPVLADVSLPASLRAVFSQHQPQVVFHAAAYKHVPVLEYHPQEAIRVNVGGTRLLAEFACEFQTERLVLISTDKAVNPSSVMGASKRIGELLVHAISQQCGPDTRFTAVRFGNVLGSRGSVVPTFNRQIESGGPVTITDQEMTRYFMSTSEAVNLVIHAACLTQGDDIFVLKMGEVVRIVDLAERMIRLRGLRPYEDIAIEFIGGRPGEKLHEELYDASEMPTETIHPHILKLDSWPAAFDPSHFLATLDRLVQGGLNGHGDALSQLLALTNGSHALEAAEPESVVSD